MDESLANMSPTTNTYEGSKDQQNTKHFYDKSTIKNSPKVKSKPRKVAKDK
jgi:hypothetical protein